MTANSSASGYDEVNVVGSMAFSACTHNPDADGFEVIVSEAWDDTTPVRNVLLTCHAGPTGVVQYALDLDKAEALARLLLSAANQMRWMINQLEKVDENES